MPVKTLINGQSDQFINVLDRGFQYGDGLFETILIEDGCATFLSQHLDRLERGCERLGFPALDTAVISAEISQLIDAERFGVLKLVISRGQGERGFLAPAEPTISRVISFSAQASHLSHELLMLPLIYCQTRLSRQPLLAGLKHLNQLERVLARNELRAKKLCEGLMLDVDGNVIEGVMSNIFLVKDKALISPCLSHSGVSGIIRDFLIEQAQQAGIRCDIRPVCLEDLEAADEIFMTNSLMPVRGINTVISPTHNLTKNGCELTEWALNCVLDDIQRQIKQTLHGLI